MTTTLLIASTNQGKVREFHSLASGLKLEMVSMSDIGPMPEVAETGATFAENARTKAAAYAISSGLMTIADDSGLEVDALGGRPGVLSARYGGDVPFAEKIRLILDDLRDVAAPARTARFRCSIAVADPSGRIVCEADGVCEGTIAQEPFGEGGFGYDPVFVPNGYVETFGQLGPEVKDSLSHRANAFLQIIPYLRGLT